VGKVDLNHEGRGDAIRHMTNLINKSSYDRDIWLQRGIKTSQGVAVFLGIEENELLYWMQKQLEDRLKGREITDHAFASCGSAKGSGLKGYTFNIYCPRGTKMMYSEPFSAYGEGAKLAWDGKSKQTIFGPEDETIIQRGTKFRVLKVEKTSTDIYFDLEVIAQI
jgi:hypothetical protein